MDNIRRVGVIVAIVAVVAVAVIGLAFFSIPGKKEATTISSVPSLPPKSSQATFPTSTSYTPYLNGTRGNGTAVAGNKVGLVINICSELSNNGTQGTPRTPRNPVVVQRGNEVSVPICFRSDDPVGTAYSLTITQFPGNPSAGYHLEEPQSYGVQASLSKHTLTIPAQTPSGPNNRLTVFDRAALSLSASGGAIAGPHVVGIQASKTGSAGRAFEILYPVYLRIE